MKCAIPVLTILVFFNGWANASTLTAISSSSFAASAQVINFDTGTTELPAVPGVTFLGTSEDFPPWYGGDAAFPGFFGTQGWGNLASTTYSELGLDLATPVQAIGGYVGKSSSTSFPNFQHPSQVEVELFDSSNNSLGTATIQLPATLGSYVFFGFTADEPIAGFRMTGNDTGFFEVDDFTYGALLPVPEPSNIVLLAEALGVVALGAWIRRRRGRFPIFDSVVGAGVAKCTRTLSSNCCSSTPTTWPRR